VVRDRVVQAALRNVIEPIFERDFAAQSYGFRPGRGTLEALRRIEELLKEGNYWVVDADIKGYFDSIPHNKLMEKVGKKISDGRVLKLIESYLKAGVMETDKGWEATPEGTPQGGVTWTGNWPEQDCKWCATPMTSSSCAAPSKKPTER
jgi:RNA-directed DNA polymerase